MENMRSRIDRGDIKLERAEAIKVSAQNCQMDDDQLTGI